jgi:TatD DNase family protein
MFLIDTHTHLFVKEFDNDRDKVISDALDSGISKMILPGINSSYIELQNSLAKAYPNHCYIAVGLHPSEVKEDFEKELHIIEEQLHSRTYIAVGEIGIDLYWDKAHETFQKKAFERQIVMAKQFQLPVIIHVRDSIDEVFEIVDRQYDHKLKGIFHSFTGTKKQADKIIEYGTFKIGINGIITFKNNSIIETVKQIDPNHIVLETDSPYLSPVPRRGQRNESAFLVHTAHKICEIKHIGINELADMTNKNALEVFGNKLLD